MAQGQRQETQKGVSSTMYVLSCQLRIMLQTAEDYILLGLIQLSRGRSYRQLFVPRSATDHTGKLSLV
jgi:hypothetical protein